MSGTVARSGGQPFAVEAPAGWLLIAAIAGTPAWQPKRSRISIRRVSINLHKCSAGAVEFEKVQP